MSNNTLDLQYSLLGNYLKKPDLFDPLQHLMREKLFTTTFTRQSYLLIKSYHAQNKVPDIMILYRDLVKAGHKEEADGVSQLNERPLKSKQVEEYVTILFNDYAADYLNEEFKKASTSKDPLESIERAKSAINNVELALNNVSKEISVKDQFKLAVNRIRNLRQGEIKQSGFSWGIPSLDKKTLGIVQGINLIGATKGGGKSSALINVIVQNVLKDKVPVIFFSLEMPAVEVLTNVIANVRRINSKLLRTGNVDEAEILSIEELEASLNDTFVIDETGGITWQYFEAKIRAFRKKNKIPYSQPILAMLDYLGLMKNSPDESRMSKEEKIEQICNELMRICKSENIHLVKLAQFSREMDKRGNDTSFIRNEEERQVAYLKAMRPRMSDFKGSAAIESNAVSILLLYRPEYYGIEEAGGQDFRGICEITVAKCRYSDVGRLLVKFTGKYNLFQDIEDSGIVTSGEESF